VPITTPVQTYKVEYFFHQGFYGWCETYWYRTNNDIAKVFAPANRLATARIKLLASGCFLDEFTISLQGLFRDSRQSDTEPQNARPGSKMDADATFVALLVRQQAGTRYRRNLYLRGLPVDLQTPVGAGNGNSQDWWTAFGQYASILLGADPAWAIQSVSREPGELGQAITAFVQGAGAFGNYTAITPTIAGAVPGDTIRVRGVRNAAFNNIPRSGTYKVINNDGTQLVLSTNWLGVNKYTAGATAAKETQLHYSGLIQSIPLRKVRRNAGVVHLQTKGRRKAKA
jgi:hypothetical protein